MLGDRKTALLRGGAPWGFRLSGGGQTPIYISKVRNRSKAALAGLAAGDTIVSVNGISSLQHSLREINDIIDSVRDQLVIEVESTGRTRGYRLDSSSSIDTRENSPVRSVHRVTPQPRQMDYYQYASARTTPTYPSYTSTSNTNYFDNNNLINREQRSMDTYGRSISNPLPALFRTAAITSSPSPTPTATARVQQFNFRPTTSNSTYDTPRSYHDPITSGYASDTNDIRRSSISLRPVNGTTPTPTATMTNNFRPAVNPQQYLSPPPPTYNSRTGPGAEQSYFSDSECVTSGPRYYKIARQVNSTRRPSNVVLPIRSITSKAYDQYVQPEAPKPQPVQQPFDVYRYQQEQLRIEREREQRERARQEQLRLEQEQRERARQEQLRLEQEQRERERQERLQRQLYEQKQQQQVILPRYNPPPRIKLPSPDPTIDHEIGAELLKSPIANKKRYADSSFFQTPYNTYPTIEQQKQLARKIANILEGGDPTQKGSTKFEKQRERADKFTVESDSTNYRPLRLLQTHESLHSNQPQPYINTKNVPDCIKHSLNEAQYINPLRYVGAPEEFKQIHMQEHVTHTNVPPQAAMSLAADLNDNRSKGAALFQKRKARSEKWVIDENNVKKQTYQPVPTYNPPNVKPWGQRAPSFSDTEGPSFSPVRPTISPSPVSIIPEQIMSPSPTPVVPRFGDFNAKPKGFNSRTAENSSPRGSIDSRKPLNLNIEPSIREGIAESHTRISSQPWSPSFNNQSMYSSNGQQNPTSHFVYPSDSANSKWKDQYQSPVPMSHDGIDSLRQRLTPTNQRSSNNPSPNPYYSSQRSHQQNFTDL